MTGSRIETGPLKIGDDWAGYFIRGDEAFAKVQVLQCMADAIERGDTKLIGYMPNMLREFAKQLEACRE